MIKNSDRTDSQNKTNSDRVLKFSMKIRSHLLVLILGAVLPLLAFSATMTAVFWREQRHALAQRYLERVRAMTIALDRELDGNIRSLQMLAESHYLQSGDLRGFYEHAARSRTAQSTWVNIILDDLASGRQLLNLRVPFGAPLPETTPDKASLATAVKSGRPFVAPLLRGRVSGQYRTAVVVPVKTNTGHQYSLVAVIAQSSWLRFLSSYPVAPGATMTLLDQNGIVIARTLDNEKWVGKPPAPALYQESRKSSEGAYRSVGLEGQRFYSAHSRSLLSGWTVATGVPEQGVEATLRESTILMGLGAVATAILAIVLALVFGRRIARPVSALAHSARALASGEQIDPGASSGLAEVAQVRAAFHEAAQRLREQEAALRESEERFRTMADTAPVLIWVSNVDKDCTYFNKPWLDFTGRTLQQELNNGWAEGVHPDDLSRCIETYRTAFDARKPFDMEYRLRRADGEYRWMLDRAAPRFSAGHEFLGYIGSCVDISERKQVEESLRRSEARLRLAMQTGKVGVWDWDILADRVVWTESLYAIHGVRPSEFSTTVEGFATLVHPEDRGFVLQALQRTLQEDAPYELEFRAVRPDGEVIWLFTNATVLREGDQPIRMLGATMDITERKLAEESLREADRRKDEYLAMLGHELRNPLGVISTTVQLLRMQPPSSPELNELRDIVERQVDHMARLLDDLLDVSRISRGQMRVNKELCDFAAIVRATAEDYRSKLEASGLRLEIDAPHQPLWVLGDRTRLAQAISNVLHNANKFTRAGGAVTIKIQEESSGGDVILSVRDTGIGMEPKILARAFEPFTQGDHGIDRSPGGLGLGLPLVKGLIELHGGDVRAASEGPGRGSELTMRLPLQAHPAPVVQPTAPSPASARSYRILVIEDNRMAARTMNMFLTRRGHTVEVAYTGREGIEAARLFQPEVILCDIGLPEFDGYKVAEQLRQEARLKRAYLIGVSGYGQEHDKERAWQSGFDAYLVKPINLLEVETLMARFSQEKGGAAEATTFQQADSSDR
jgi:PAS domain S-box-containing protein